jgi:hypothetical protein
MTKYTPYEIFVRKANIPGCLQQSSVPSYNYDDLIHDIRKKLQVYHIIARSNLILTKQRRLENQKDKICMPLFRKGDTVLLRNEKPGNLVPLWLGPYKVLERDQKGSNAVIELTK